ncbi:TonB C-terminal domain-containing protein [Colwelliaceae bacterium BS250]
MKSILLTIAILFTATTTVAQELASKCTTIEACAQLIQDKISSNILWQEEFSGQEVVISFRLNDDAEVSNIKVVSVTGKKYMEKIVKDAIKASSPFDELMYLDASDYEQVKFIKLTYVGAEQ